MVAQTKADARSVAGKPDATDKKWLQQDASSGKDLDEQAAAAGVVDVDQAQTVAEAAVMPTDAPVDGVGLLAQTTMTPADPPADPSTTGTTGTTPPPEVEEPGTISPWIVGGAAILGFGAVAAIVDNNDDDDDDPIGIDPPAPPPAEPGPAPAPAPEPGPAPAPAPTNVPPTSQDATITTQADGTTPLGAGNFFFADGDAGDTRAGVRIDTINPTAIDTTTSDSLAIAPGGHGYELVQGVTSWAQANAAAVARGGYLAVLDSLSEMEFVRTNFDSLGPTTGESGAWVGLSQAANAANPGDGWTWVDGSALPGDSPLWNNDFNNVLPADFGDEGSVVGEENHQADFGAISNGSTPPDNALLYDWGATGGAPGSPSLPQYLIEYNSTAALTLNGAPVAPGTPVAEADLANLTWNSVFNTGGTVTYSVSDGEAFSTTPNTLTFTAPAAPLSVATMIDDQSANNLV